MPSSAEALLVGIDLGSGALKVSVVDASARVVVEAREPYGSASPHPRWVEQDPARWWDAGLSAMDRAMMMLSAVDRRRVRGIAVTGATHVAVLTDAADAVLRPAIMWNDQRSAEQSRRLADAHGATILAVTGNTPTPTWTLSHLMWLRDHEPDVLDRTARVRFMKDWLRDRLSERPGHVTDRVDAQGALAWDGVEHRWSDPLLTAVGLAADVFPDVVEPTAISGALRRDLAERWGLAQATPLVTGTTDTAAELLAAGAVRTGDVVIKLATAGNVALVAPAPGAEHGILSYEHVVPGRYYLNSATNAASRSLSWFAESFLGDSDPATFARIDDAVTLVPAGADGLLFTPFLYGERSPRFDDRLRGGFLGFTARHGWQESARAVMEGVAFSLRDAAALHGSLPGVARMVGGGTLSAVWPQIVADIFGREIAVHRSADSSVGAALIAGIGTGVFSSFDDVAARVGSEAFIVEPIAQHVRRYDRRFADYLDFAASTTSIAHRLSDDP